MKVLTTLVCIFICSNLLSQRVSSFVDISGSALFVKGSDQVTPYGLIAIGPVLGKSQIAGIGFGVGYLKYKGSRTGVIPFGLRTMIMPYTGKKASPVFIMGAYFPIYNETYSANSRVGTTYTSVRIETKGIFMGDVGLGIMLPASKKTKLRFTGHYNPIVLKSAMTITSSGTTPRRTSGQETTSQFSIALGVIFLGTAGKLPKPKR
jgi:hypothetical protein